MCAQRVLVTGGTGFIGRSVIEAFLAAGHETRSFAFPGETAPSSWHGRVQICTGDLFDRAALTDASQGCDVIIHLAGLVGHAGAYERQWAIFVDGTRNVCRAAASAGARLVVCTSIAVYGTLIQTHVCEESLGHGPWAGAELSG
jgi:dTDP-glucose 4,6-dehydratase